VASRFIKEAVLGEHRRRFWAITTVLGATLVKIVFGDRNSNGDALPLARLHCGGVNGGLIQRTLPTGRGYWLGGLGGLTGGLALYHVCCLSLLA
jgi:hypothetical protein